MLCCQLQRSNLVSRLVRPFTATRTPGGRAAPTLSCTEIGRTTSSALVLGSAVGGAGPMLDPPMVIHPQGGSAVEERASAASTEQTINASGALQQTQPPATVEDSGAAAAAHSQAAPRVTTVVSLSAGGCVGEQPLRSSGSPRAVPPAAVTAAAMSVSGASHPATVEGQVDTHVAGGGRKRALDTDEGAPAPKKQEVAADYKKQWGPRPTHFLAVKLSQHPKVVQAFQQVQAALVKANPALKPTCIDPASAHITLFVLTLDGTKLQQALDVMQQLQQQPPASQPQQHLAHPHQEDSQQEAEEGVQDDHLHSSSSGAVPSPRQQACEPTPQPPSIQEPAMFGSRQGGSEPISSTPKRTCADDKQHTAEPAKPAGPQGHPEVWVQACQEVTLEAPWSSFEMDLRGLGHFNDKVLFLQVAPGDGLAKLHRLNDAVVAAFQAAGLYKDQPPFEPHATIAKMSKLYNKQRKAAGKRFPAAAYAELENMEGGRVLVEQVVLCRMQGRREGAFYPVEGCIRLL